MQPIGGHFDRTGARALHRQNRRLRAKAPGDKARVEIVENRGREGGRERWKEGERTKRGV